MPSDVTLHIGTPKSGTTHLQAVLSAGRGPLAQAGVLYPGAAFLPRHGFNQQPAVYALGRRYIGWVDDEARVKAEEYLTRLAGEIARHDGRLILSAESLAFFDTSEIAALFRELDLAPDRTTVVITARDLGRVLPSIWQQNIKNGSVEPLDEYLRSVAMLRGRPDVPIWTAFGLPGLVERWSRQVGVERVVLVTAPRGDRSALWTRFATAAGLPADLPDRTGAGTVADDNRSLTQVQTELLRRLNLELRESAHDVRSQGVLRRRLLDLWMSRERPAAAPIVMPAGASRLVVHWATEDNARLAAGGVRIIGSLDDLAPSPPGAQPPTRSDLDEVAADLLPLVERLPAGPPTRPRPRRITHRIRRRAAALLPRARRRVVDLTDAAGPGPTTAAAVDASGGRDYRRG